MQGLRPYTVQIILLLACARPKSLMLHANGQHCQWECSLHFSTAQGEQDPLLIDADTARAQPSLLADHCPNSSAEIQPCQVAKLDSLCQPFWLNLKLWQPVTILSLVA